MLPSLALSLISLAPIATFAATAEQWRTRSIYQLITDRFALPAGSGIDPTACDPAKQQFCGGTWQSIIQNLDYIQNMGFTAIWISPVNQNIPGPTAYGDPYHGYWISDITQLNSKFGTADDLKQLSAEVHKRNMYLMVDIVVNNVAATSTTPDYSPYLFKDPSQYHKYCPIDWENSTSVEQCWLGDTKVTLPDLNTEDPVVVDTYNKWIGPFVQEYGIDGLRIDAAKHVRTEFWGPFCQAAGVYCVGEVFGSDMKTCASYQDPSSLDAVLNFPQYGALTSAFAIPGPRNMSALVDVFNHARTAFKDVTVLGNFLENQDLPRWANMSVDPQSMYNALTFSFMSDGIPIVYYGQEQHFHGVADPLNREPLWPSGYQMSDAYNFIAMLNMVRNLLISQGDWATQPAQIISYTENSIFLAKGYIISVMTNIGSPPQNISASMVNSGFASGQLMIDVISCDQVVVGSRGSLNVDYTKGGRAAILIPEYYIRGSAICQAAQKTSLASTGPAPKGAPHPSAATPTMRIWSWGFSSAAVTALTLGSLTLLGTLLV